VEIAHPAVLFPESEGFFDRYLLPVDSRFRRHAGGVAEPAPVAG
jgi:hypothetical protein